MARWTRARRLREVLLWPGILAEGGKLADGNGLTAAAWKIPVAFCYRMLCLDVGSQVLNQGESELGRPARSSNAVLQVNHV